MLLKVYLFKLVENMCENVWYVLKGINVIDEKFFLSWI